VFLSYPFDQRSIGSNLIIMNSFIHQNSYLDFFTAVMIKTIKTVMIKTIKTNSSD
jgi:hypothetical protein